VPDQAEHPNAELASDAIKIAAAWWRASRLIEGYLPH